MTGGGDSEHFRQLDQHFISLLSKEASLLFIPLAGEPEDYNDGLERIQQTFSTIEFENIEMCLDLDTLTWDYLAEFDAIYIDGGNTFKLMDAIRRSHFYELTRQFLHFGGVINGDSAGAIIMGSHLETAHFGDMGDENESGLKCYQGLNFLGDIAIHCHYQPGPEEEEIARFVDDYGFPVLALREETGVYIGDGMLHVIGETPATYFSPLNTHVVEPGQMFPLQPMAVFDPKLMQQFQSR